MSQYRTPFEALGEDRIRELAAAFYDVMDELPEAAEIRAMHARDLGPMKEKLGDYLVGWMGGPPRYADKHGTVCMTEPHEPYAIGPRERDQWLLCMQKAMDRIEVDAEVQDMLRQPLYRVADAVRNRAQSTDTLKDPNIIAAS